MIRSYFLKYTAYQTKRGNAYSIYFDRFYCIAPVPWLNRSGIHAMYGGTWCERQNATRSISGFPNIWQIMRKTWKFNFQSNGSFPCLDWNSAWVFITLGKYFAVMVTPEKAGKPIFLCLNLWASSPLSPPLLNRYLKSILLSIWKCIDFTFLSFLKVNKARFHC